MPTPPVSSSRKREAAEAFVQQPNSKQKTLRAQEDAKTRTQQVSSRVLQPPKELQNTQVGHWTKDEILKYPLYYLEQTLKEQRGLEEPGSLLCAYSLSGKGLQIRITALPKESIIISERSNSEKLLFEFPPGSFQREKEMIAKATAEIEACIKTEMPMIPCRLEAKMT